MNEYFLQYFNDFGIFQGMFSRLVRCSTIICEWEQPTTQHTLILMRYEIKVNGLDGYIWMRRANLYKIKKKVILFHFAHFVCYTRIHITCDSSDFKDSLHVMDFLFIVCLLSLSSSSYSVLKSFIISQWFHIVNNNKFENFICSI